MQPKRLNYLKTFLLGFGFFGVSVIWSVYNAFVPLILDERFGLQAGFIAFIMVLDNIAALIIQPALGVFSDRLRHVWPHPLFSGSAIIHLQLHHPSVGDGFLANTCCGAHA